MDLEVRVDIVVKPLTITSINERKQILKLHIETKFRLDENEVDEFNPAREKDDRWRIVFVQPPIFEPLLQVNAQASVPFSMSVFFTNRIYYFASKVLELKELNNNTLAFERCCVVVVVFVSVSLSVVDCFIQSSG